MTVRLLRSSPVTFVKHVISRSPAVRFVKLNLEFSDHTNNGLRSSSVILMRITDGEPSVTPSCCASSGIITVTLNDSVLSVIESWMISTAKIAVTCNGFKVTFVLNGR